MLIHFIINSCVLQHSITYSPNSNLITCLSPHSPLSLLSWWGAELVRVPRCGNRTWSAEHNKVSTRLPPTAAPFLLNVRHRLLLQLVPRQKTTWRLRIFLQILYTVHVNNTAECKRILSSSCSLLSPLYSLCFWRITRSLPRWTAAFLQHFEVKQPKRL